ncbi:MAG: TrmH family RNA methyltransferase, partial [Pyrinomonadaceae bacterium]
DGKERDLIFIEGLRLCEEALRSRLKIDAVIYSEEIAQKGRAAVFLEEAEKVSERLASVTEKLLATISYTKTPQGIVALARRPESGPHRLEMATVEAPLLTVIHGINNPVNVGAILRSAEAAGVSGVIATTNTSDPFSPKSLRGAMGSAFRLPIWFGSSYQDALAWCAEHEIETVCTSVNAETLYTGVDWTRRQALIVGPEATGLTAEEIKSAQLAVRIPMRGEVESLNVAVATAIVLYEAARQRSQMKRKHDPRNHTT